MYNGHIPAVKQVDGVWRIMPNVHLWSGREMPELKGKSPAECAAWIFSKRMLDLVHVLDAKGVVTNVIHRNSV